MKIILLTNLKKFFLFVFILSLTTYLSISAQNQDSLKNKNTSFEITYNQIPSLYQGMYRYAIVNDYTENWYGHSINRSIQNSLSSYQLQTNTFNDNYLYLKNTASKSDYRIDLATDKQLFYGIWRAKLITIENESELKQQMDYGVNFLINKGYSIEEILPFITLLMQENYDYHYDNSRAKPFGKGAKGIYTTTDILKSFRTPNTAIVVGVCRDVHDAGLRMMREICTTYYNTLYAEKNINIDDYLFLTSWATQSSQHVTISLIDPLNTKKTYELDWGRFIEKTDNVGYEHGRNYGNVYRVWKFDSKKNITRPIDSKKTNIGNFLDDQLYTVNEFETFNGIKNIEPYSAFKFRKKLKKRIEINTSLGELSQNQKFLQATINHRSKELGIGKYFLYNGVTSFQTMLIEESEKKNLMFPIQNYSRSNILYFFPRYIANLKTKKIKLSKNITSNFYATGSIELFLYLDQYKLSNTGTTKRSQSADGGIYFTQGYQINYKTSSTKFETEIKLQNRSFLIPKEIRLMTPNPGELLSNARLVSPAQDVVLNLSYIFTPNLSIKTKTILEYTNLKNIITDNQLELQNKINKVGYLSLSGGICKMVKGIEYFWYPVNRSNIGLNYSTLEETIKAGINLRKYNDNELVFGVQLSLGF